MSADKVIINGEKYFSKSELEEAESKAREETFRACREWSDGQWSNQFFPDGKNSQFKYPTIEDYRQSLNTLNKEESGKESSWVFCSDCKNKGLCSFRGKCDNPKPSPLKDKEQEVLFTTTGDIVNMGLNDTYWYIDERFKLYAITIRSTQDILKGVRQYADKEKAEQYILENKPCLSLNDCAIGIPKRDFEQLTEIAKQKLKQ